jgi:phosphate transport system protein
MATTMLRTTFTAELENLDKQLLRMGSFVENMLGSAIKSLVEQNENLANEVILRDDIVDEMDVSIEHLCMRLLALQQPLAKDLRTVGTALKIITDLERIGDYAVDIARLAKSLAHEPYFKPLVDIPQMGAVAQSIVRDALRSFIERDLQLVREVCERDAEVDHLWHALLAELIEHMEKEPWITRQAVALLLAARYLERIADHATNIAERVSYTETGELLHIAKVHAPRLEDPDADAMPEDDQPPTDPEAPEPPTE